MHVMCTRRSMKLPTDILIVLPILILVVMCTRRSMKLPAQCVQGAALNYQLDALIL